MNKETSIAAVVLAAGLSRRMGRPKMVLPWGKRTVIENVVHVLHQAGIKKIVVVTGGARAEIEQALKSQPVECVFNPEYERDEMVLSLQTGLKSLPKNIDAVLVVLGDQPQIEAQVVDAIISRYDHSKDGLIVPSFHMRRGHPWMVRRKLWPDILRMAPPKNLRDFMHSHVDEIRYVNVQTASVLADLDTPDDYERERPG